MRSKKDNVGLRFHTRKLHPSTCSFTFLSKALPTDEHMLHMSKNESKLTSVCTKDSNHF